jgi:hypothetical protein
MPGLTVHTIIRNEPFVYYAIKSVYDYADKILLCDTGSDDPITLDAISRILHEDYGKKIRFQALQLEDMTHWRGTERSVERAETLRSIWNQQIIDTETEFFLIVDGDEVHYRDGIRQVVEEILPNWSTGKTACFLPIRWHTDLHESMSRLAAPSRVHGRVFRTTDVHVEVCGNRGEMHCSNRTNKVLLRRHPQAFIAADVQAFAHFSAYLKPYHVITKGRRRFLGLLPEVMCADDSFIARYQKKASGELGA